MVLYLVDEDLEKPLRVRTFIRSQTFHGTSVAVSIALLFTLILLR